ncbi:MAG: hypothetical protein M3R62_00705, partial [Acidobacteriota bacterium]|nr:hypothetical protein [Acidobacteriota bacterium]
MPFRRSNASKTIGGGINSAPALPRTTLRAGAAALFSAWIALAAACRPASAPRAAPAPAPPRAAVSLEERAGPLLDLVERRTFDYFWELTNPKNGLVPDRAPTPSFSSIAAGGFALTAYPIGVERGYVTRQQARDRVLTTLRFFARPA